MVRASAHNFFVNWRDGCMGAVLCLFAEEEEEEVTLSLYYVCRRGSINEQAACCTMEG